MARLDSEANPDILAIRDLPELRVPLDTLAGPEIQDTLGGQGLQVGLADRDFVDHRELFYLVSMKNSLQRNRSKSHHWVRE